MRDRKVALFADRLDDGFWELRYDLRAPAFAPRIESLYAAALEQIAWGDEQGFAQVVVARNAGTPATLAALAQLL